MIVRRAVEPAGIFRKDNGGFGNAHLVISAAVQKFITDAVRQVNGIRADLPRFLGPSLFERESVRFEISAVGLCFVNFVAVGDVGNDRLGKDNDFSCFQGGRLSLDGGAVAIKLGCSSERGSEIRHLAVIIRGVQIGNQARFSVVCQLVFIQLVPSESDIMGKQQGHEAVLAEVGAPDASVSSGQLHIHIIRIPPDVHGNDGDTEVDPSSAVRVLVAVFDVVKPYEGIKRRRMGWRMYV